jgi:histidinol-phosphatase
MQLARSAADLALPAFHKGVTSTKKADGSIVTETDLAVERHLLDELLRQRPQDAVLSEESGASGGGVRRWILDPIDGTWWFAHGKPSWGTHIALEVDGELTLGIVTRPLQNLCWWAAAGRGAYQDELGSCAGATRLHVRPQGPVADARVMVWANGETELCRRLKADKRWVEPSIDGPIDVASGRLDALVDELSQIWDIAPGVILVREAGGCYVDREGGTRLGIGGCLSNGL